MKKVEIKTVISEYDSLDELSNEDQNLIQKANQSALKAYAPYSKFNVGAAVLLEDGQIIMGNNQENAAYPSGLCAERVAMFYANSQFPELAVKAIAVCVFYNQKFIEAPAPPCGACRQVLLETEARFKKPIKVILAGSKRIQIIDSARELLPINFDDNFFK